MFLASLYNDDGTPSEINEPEYQSEVDAETESLKAARLNLCDSSYIENDGIDYYKALSALVGRTASLRAEDYEETSWQAFQEARNAADTYVKETATPTVARSGANDIREIISLWKPLYRAYYYGLQSREDEITVSLRVADNIGGVYPTLALTDEKTALFSGELSLSGENRSLQGAVTAADLSFAADMSGSYQINPGLREQVFIFVNGILVVDPVNGNNTDRELRDYGAVFDRDGRALGSTEENLNMALRDGDDVLIFRTERAMVRYYISLTAASYFKTYRDDIKLLSIAEKNAEPIEATEGEAFELTVTATPGTVASFTGINRPAEGIGFVYGPAAETPEAVRGPARAAAGTTDQDGKIALTLYKAGWYYVSALDRHPQVYGSMNADGIETPGEYPQLAAGDGILVHVLSLEEAEFKKALAEYDNKIDALLNSYNEDFIGETLWKQMLSRYYTAKAAIATATNLEEAQDVLDAAKPDMKEIQDRAAAENTSKLRDFRDLLNRLPADLSQLDQSVGHIVEEGLTPLYESMSSYQRGLLTGAELSRYNAAKALCAAGLPEAAAYNLSFRFVGDSDETTAALNDMLTYLQSRQSYEDASGSGYSGDALEEIGLFRVIDRAANNSWNGVLSENAAESFADDIVDVAVSFDYDAYFLVRDDEDHTLSGSGWEITDENFGFSDYYADSRGYTYYDVISGFTVKLNGTEYEIKKVRCSGVAEKDITKRDLSVLDYSAYRGKDENNVNVNFLSALYRFNMPYRDVAVEVVWGPVSGDTAEYAVDELTRTLSGYDKANYTAADWKKLTNAYYEGVNNIYKAGDKDGIIAAKNEALAAMAAVPLRAEDDYGSVSVRFYNNTYEDGLGYDESKPFISETIALEAGDSMMTAGLKALVKNDYTWGGTGGIGMNIEYLAGIAKNGVSLSEFDGGGASGWMGTLNDWFVNESFSSFTVNSANESTRLRDGDVIKIMYTVTGYGFDLGASWENNDTSLKALSLSGAAAQPEFAADTYEYIATLDHNPLTAFAVNAEAANKNFQTRIYVNSRSGLSWYPPGAEIPVKAGDVIYIGVGEASWPTMNTGKITGTWYTVYVLGEGNSMTRQAEALIADLPEAENAGLEEEEAIRFAEAFCEHLSAEDLAKVSNREKLDALLAKIEALKAVEDVSALIAKLPSANAVQIDDEEAVDAAEKAYGELEPWQKDAMQQRYGLKLSAVREALEELKEATFDERAAAAVIRQINALPEEIALSDAEEVAAAREAFEALSDEQKDFVTSRVQSKLLTAEQAIAELKAAKEAAEQAKADEAAAKEAEALIAAIGEVTLDSKDVIEAAGSAFDALTENQKKLVTNADILTAAEAAYKELKDADDRAKAEAEADRVAAKAAEDRVSAIGEVTLDSKDAIRAARSAYDALTENQKKLVTNAEVLTAAEAAYDALKAAADKANTAAEADRAAAKVAADLIAAVGDVTLDSKDAIQAARSAYNALSESQKQLVTNADDLTAAETAFKALKDAADEANSAAEADRAAAKEAEDLISAIGSVTADSKDAIEAARSAYDALTEAQKQLVTNADDLPAAEAAYEEAAAKLEEDKAKAEEAAALIGAIGEVTLDSKDAIEAAESAYDALTDDQKQLVTNAEALAAAKAAYAELIANLPVPFVDIEGHWGEDAIINIYRLGLVNGVSENRFAPDMEITRGMVVTILYRLEGEPAVSESCAFNDVAAGRYYRDAVIWAND
ncbi:MAG: S-layer homology domain-containing protein, partial [Bacillota bacterium]